MKDATTTLTRAGVPDSGPVVQSLATVRVAFGARDVVPHTRRTYAETNQNRRSAIDRFRNLTLVSCKTVVPVKCGNSHLLAWKRAAVIEPW